MEALLAELPRDEAEALRARVVDEQDYREIASELQCSEAVVRKRVSRGLARLRAAMRTAP
jgi:RNA polymerase sigma-70 factor (ECF subfamily)